jgi:glycosyltransferase involved in cell wall biosynthesis
MIDFELMNRIFFESTCEKWSRLSTFMKGKYAASDSSKDLGPVYSTSVRKAENTGPKRRKLVWVSFLVLDVLFHKTSRIEILEHLAERGYTVYLIAMRSRRKDKFRNPNIHVVSIPLRYSPGISPLVFAGILFFFLPFYIAFLNPDFIVTEPDISVLGLIWAPVLSRLRRCRIVLDIRSTPVETKGLLGYIQALFFTFSVFWAKRFFDGMTIITTLMKKEVCAEYRVDPGFIGVWTSGVSPTLFNPEKYREKGSQLRQEFGLTHKFIVFYHGSFSAKRGAIECIKSIEMLKGKYENVVIFFLGSGPALPEMQSMIQRRGINHRVFIHDPVDYSEVPKYIAMCDIGIIPLANCSDWRNQCPLKLLEYLCMEKIVILTDIPAHLQVIGQNRCGIVVSSASATEIAEAIKYAYDNKEKLKEFESCGRAIVNMKYTWKKVAADFDGYLSSLETPARQARSSAQVRYLGW